MFGMKSFASGCGAFALGVALFGSVAASAAEPVTLKMVGAWAPGFSPTAEVGKNFMENVNRLGEGKVTINYIGADDVLPPFDQPEALVNGVFDVWYGAPNYWAGVVPGGDITELSPLTVPDGGPGSPLYEYLVEVYAAKGVRHIGHAAGDPGEGTHYINTNFPVASVDDLKGKKLRVSPLNRHFVQAVGGESITLPPAEIFLATHASSAPAPRPITAEGGRPVSAAARALALVVFPIPISPNPSRLHPSATASLAISMPT